MAGITGHGPNKVRRNRDCPWCKKQLEGEAYRVGPIGYNHRGRYYHEHCLRMAQDADLLRAFPVLDRLTDKQWISLRDWHMMRAVWQRVVVLPPVEGRGRGRPPAATTQGVAP